MQDYPPVEVHGWIAAAYAQLGVANRVGQALQNFRMQAREEFARSPGDGEAGWHTYWWWILPYKHDEDLENLLEGLRRADLQV